jgi:hypothetical protein
MKTKLFLLILLGCITLHTSSYAHRGSCFFGNVAGSLVGSLIGTSIANDIAIHRVNRFNRAVNFNTENRIYVYEMIRDYNPLYHSQYVNCIAASCLPESQKLAAIATLNEKYAAWISAGQPQTFPVVTPVTQVNYYYQLPQ